jgi:hypothetical protein
MDTRTAQKLCSLILDKNMKSDCIFDVTVTGEASFAQTYLITQQLQSGATKTTVKDNKDPTKYGENVIFTATVTRTDSNSGSTPTGNVQFILDGVKIGNPVTLDTNNRAVWSISNLQIGKHQVSANYIPSHDSVFLVSNSPEESHLVIETQGQFFWLIIIVILIFIIFWYLRTRGVVK